MNLRARLVVYAAIVTAMVCWGLTFIWYKQVYPMLTPVTVVTLRLFCASLILLAIAFLVKKPESIRKKDLPQFLILTLFEPFIYFLGESYGLRYISSTLASLMIAAIPLIIPVAAWVYFKEKLTFGNYLGILFSILGVFLVIKTDIDSYGSTLTGILCMTVAILSTIGFSIYVRKLSEKYKPFTIVTYQNIFGLTFFLPVFLLTDAHAFINQFQIQHLAMFLPVVKLALFGSVIAFILFIYGISRIGIARANVFANLIPVFTAVFAYFILAEKFSIGKIAGIIIVITGLILSQMGDVFVKKNLKKKNTDQWPVGGENYVK